MSRDTMCPATMCPYLGLTDGSPWTSDEADGCDDSCGWWQGEYCLAGAEHDMDVWAVEGPLPAEDEWPACPYAEKCQWQAQRDGPCAPRAQLLLGMTIDEVTMV